MPRNKTGDWRKNKSKLKKKSHENENDRDKAEKKYNFMAHLSPATKRNKIER